MDLHVRYGDDGHRLRGGDGDVDLANRYLTHLTARGFSPATVRAYAFDILNFLRFCAQRGLGLLAVAPGDLFDYLDWQSRPAAPVAQTVVRIDRRNGAAASTMNRRVAAVRGMFEYLLVVGERADNPVPAARHARF